MPKRTASAKWDGSLREGSGTIGLGSGAWEGPYSARSRFEDAPESNPEELLAAAHAGCFTMALSLILGMNDHEPETLETEAIVHLQQKDGGYEIPQIDLVVKGTVPGIDQDEFVKHATTAKEVCPLSKALASVEEITLDAQLSS
ncbi:MAG TPA: OsmC family protein [Solirubrobacterales bacterium]|nr:OsmC family protein [Solirubrobacterales bacterium]